MIAAFPMYDWPEVQAENDELWAQMRTLLRAKDIQVPENLARRNADLPARPGGIRNKKGDVVAPDPSTLEPDGFDLVALWRHPDLLLSQTCWGPMEQGLAGHVALIAQPDYSAFDGGRGELYSSALLVRKAAHETPVARFADLIPALRGKRLAFNGSDSMSGLIALSRDLEAAGSSLSLFSEQAQTGSHRASIRAVASGNADSCAIDCRTWDLAQRFEPAAQSLKVIGWTAPRKGLPFVTARGTPKTVVEALRSVLSELKLI